MALESIEMLHLEGFTSEMISSTVFFNRKKGISLFKIMSQMFHLMCMF